MAITYNLDGYGRLRGAPEYEFYKPSPDTSETNSMKRVDGDNLQPSEKVNQVVSRGIGGDLIKGLLRSKFVKATLFSGLAVALFGIYMLVFGVTPSPWMIVATAVGGYALGLLIQLPFGKGLQKTQFEIAAIRRLFNKTNYDEIIEIEGGVKIVLGALPNQLGSEGKTLAKKEKVGAVLSVNQPLERLPRGLSLPYTANDWQELGILYQEMDVKDHTPLNNDELNQAADFINAQLDAGKNVYVHCRAGRGRSAMAVAAYLIKYRKKSVEDACWQIIYNRSISTIREKQDELVAYKTSLDADKKSLEDAQVRRGQIEGVLTPEEKAAVRGMMAGALAPKKTEVYMPMMADVTVQQAKGVPKSDIAKALTVSDIAKIVGTKKYVFADDQKGNPVILFKDEDGNLMCENNSLEFGNCMRVLKSQDYTLGVFNQKI